MSRLRLFRRCIGMRWNYSLKGLDREQCMDQIQQGDGLVGFYHLWPLFCPRPDFTNRVIWFGEDDDVYSRKVMNPLYGPIPEDYDPNVHGYCDPNPIIGQTEGVECIMVRTKTPADGGILRGKNKAIAFFNADCPIIALAGGLKQEILPGEHDKIAVLHAGFRTLIREDKDEPNIIESAMQYFNPKYTRAFIGYGIGPCCWVPEYANKLEVLEPTRSRDPELLASCLNKTTEASPFGPGHVSVDLYKLAKELLMKVGIPENQILIRDQCTCCATENGKPLFWSHNRFRAGKQDIDGRNMAIAFLTTHLENDGFETL